MDLYTHVLCKIMEEEMLTRLVVLVFKSIQPVEAEDHISIRSLHQRELAGVHLHFHRSLDGFPLLNLLPAHATTQSGSEERKLDGYGRKWLSL